MKNLILVFVLILQYGVCHAQCDRLTVVQDYNDVFLQTSFNSSEISWNGDPSNCDEGGCSSSTRQKMLDRINYFRRLCDLNDDVVFSEEKNQMCQEAAMMSVVNQSLSHCLGQNNAPCDNWTCTTESGILASQKSNLAWGNWDIYDPVELFISDYGAGNIAVGHRRWILYSRAKEFGCGLTEDRNILWVLGNYGNPAGNQRDYIAYPPGDYIVQDLVYPRWSFGIPQADFTDAEVQMLDENGNQIELNIIYNASVGYGDYSIVWEPEGILVEENYDVEYHVNISNIGNAPNSSYTYTVKIVTDFYPPNCELGLVWSEENCQCQSEPDCPEEVVVNESPIHGTFEAMSLINSSGKVSENSNALFLSGNEIILAQGFEVEPGSEFSAGISDHPCFEEIINSEDSEKNSRQKEGFYKLQIPVYTY